MNSLSHSPNEPAAAGMKEQHQQKASKQQQQQEKILESTVKTFEDAAFEMLSTVSPIKLPRDEIPFDSVREIVLGEILKMKQQQKAVGSARNSGRRKDMDDILDEAPSSSSSSSHIHVNDVESASSSGILERGTMTDEPELTPRSIAARLYGDCTRSSSTSSASAPCLQSDVAAETKKKPMNYREKRLAEIRHTRLKKYRENAELVEFKCEENCLAEAFCKYYGELLDDEPTAVGAASIYFRIVESLDVYFRAKTWESNCPKLLCEFLCENILKTCQQLNDSHESKNSGDEKRAKECQIQVLLTLHVFVVTDEKRFLDEAVHKLRMIYIAAGAEQLRHFVEGPVTDVYWELIGDGLATIYDELCINLPADLQQYDNSLFKMTESDDSTMIVKRRNGTATRLEQMLIETSAEFGVGGVERTGGRIPAAVALAMEAPIVRRSLKRRAEETPKELLSPTRPSRSTGSTRADYKQFFVEDTPDEKYAKRVIKKEPKASDDDDDDDIDVGEDPDERAPRLSRIEEQIEEEVKQTPMAKLRMAANKSGHRCSKRLSDLVKLSEERAQVPRKARENLDKFLEKAKASTPLRSVGRQTRKSVLFGATPTSSPMSTRASRTSLLQKFTKVENKKSAEESDSDEEREDRDSDYSDVGVKRKEEDDDDEEEDEDEEEEEEEEDEEEEEAPVTAPVVRQRGTRRRGAPARYRDAFADKQKAVRVKEEIEDVDFDEIETGSSLPSSSSSGPPSSAGGSKSGQKWTDRQLKRQLGLTREDLNRYREAMLTTGERKKINWESAQMNRAGRIKGEDGKIFGIRRRNVRTMICHVLLNDTNPDTSFNWNKVKFDDMGDKPRTRSMQSLMQKPEQYMETLKKKYIASKSPSKKTRSVENLMAAGGTSSSSSASLPSSSTSSASSSKKRTSSGVVPRKRSSGASRSRSGLVEPTRTSSGSHGSSAPKKKQQLDDFGIESEADD